MGVSVHYWAIPPASTLLRRLQHEPPFATLMCTMFPYGGGIFNFFNESDREETEEILAWLIENRRESLGYEVEARRCIEEFRQEFDQTRLANPGVEGRRTSLQKTSQLIEERSWRVNAQPWRRGGRVRPQTDVW